MTNEFQSDRPGGDGLREKLVAFSDFLNEPPQYEELRMVRDYRHEACAKWLPLVTDLIARFDATPTRDAAEGAAQMKCPTCGDDVNDIVHALDCDRHLQCAPPNPAPEPAVAPDRVRVWDEERGACFLQDVLAPDAMREALLKYLDIFLHPNPKVDLSGLVCQHGLAVEACPSRECSNPMAYETAIKRARDYIAALAAPVPPLPADVQAKFYAVLSKSIPHKMIDDIWQDIKEARVFAGTVNPPVRGDREAIAETIHEARFPPDRTPTMFAAEDAQSRAYCFRIADAILSLPVQPGVGERP